MTDAINRYCRLVEEGAEVGDPRLLELLEQMTGPRSTACKLGSRRRRSRYQGSQSPQDRPRPPPIRRPGPVAMTRTSDDPFTRLMEREGLTFPEAVERLAAEAGLIPHSATIMPFPTPHRNKRGVTKVTKPPKGTNRPKGRFPRANRKQASRYSPSAVQTGIENTNSQAMEPLGLHIAAKCLVRYQCTCTE